MLPLKIKQTHRKKKKQKYKKVVLKFSDQQMKSLQSYCQANDISVNKFIKRSIKHATDGKYNFKHKKNVSHNKQIDLEDLIDLMENES